MRTRSLAGWLMLSASLALPTHAQTLSPYPGASDIAPPMVHNDHYDPVHEAGVAPDIDPEKGYRIEDFGAGAYMVTEGAYQMMIVRTDDGLVIADAPPSIGENILKAAEEIAPGAKITHLIYSHGHVDHIGFAAQIVATNPDMQIIAHQDTAATLERAADPNRPPPGLRFDGSGPFTLQASNQILDLNYSGPNHEYGNIEIWHPESKTLMLIDVVFPGWMMWRRMAIAQDIPGVYDVVGQINAKYDFEHLVAGHVGRAGTKADVDEQLAFMTDLHAAALNALGSTAIAEGMNPEDTTNPWAVFDNFIDRATVQCVAELAPEWRDKLSGFDVFIYDQCMAMEQSIRVDGPSL